MTAYPRQSNPEWSALLAYQAQGKISKLRAERGRSRWWIECVIKVGARDVPSTAYGETREQAASSQLWLVRNALEKK